MLIRSWFLRWVASAPARAAGEFELLGREQDQHVSRLTLKEMDAAGWGQWFWVASSHVSTM